MEPKHWRALFISDVHLGTPYAKAHELLRFLDANTADVYYLVGDIIDGWAMKRSLAWPKAHTKVMHRLVQLSRNNPVFYIPGNHDEIARQFSGHHFEGIRVVDETIHVTKGFIRYRVSHGDEFDAVVQNAKWLAYLGSAAYDVALALNARLIKVQRLLHLKTEWSLSATLKNGIKQAVAYIDGFEQAAATRAVALGNHGAICGHIHTAADKIIILRDGARAEYRNCGDWVESCTALGEDQHGNIGIIQPYKHYGG